MRMSGGSRSRSDKLRGDAELRLPSDPAGRIFGQSVNVGTILRAENISWSQSGWDLFLFPPTCRPAEK
jgi:hypothetical protein